MLVALRSGGDDGLKTNDQDKATRADPDMSQILTLELNDRHRIPAN